MKSSSGFNNDLILKSVAETSPNQSLIFPGEAARWLREVSSEYSNPFCLTVAHHRHSAQHTSEYIPTLFPASDGRHGLCENSGLEILPLPINLLQQRFSPISGSQGTKIRLQLTFV